MASSKAKPSSHLQGIVIFFQFGDGASRRGWNALWQSAGEALAPLGRFNLTSWGGQLTGTLNASCHDAVWQILTPLIEQAIARKAAVECAQFGAFDEFQVRVWKPGARTPKAYDPADARIKTDYLFLRKGMIEDGLFFEARTSAETVKCLCGAQVQPDSKSCDRCGQAFTRPLAVLRQPKSASSVHAAIRELASLGVAGPGDATWQTATLWLPENARQWLGATAVLKDFGFRLQSPQEFSQRCELLRQAQELPQRYPLAAAHSLREWLRQITELRAPGTAVALDKKAVTSMLARAGSVEQELLLTLATSLHENRCEWIAALLAENLDARSVIGHAAVALAVPLALAGVPLRPLSLDPEQTEEVDTILAELNPAALTRAAQKRLLADAEFDRAEWVAMKYRIESVPLRQLIRSALTSDNKLSGECLDWFLGGPLPRLRRIEASEILSALRQVEKQGLPPSFAKRLKIARAAQPPYGIEPRPLWELTPIKPSKAARKSATPVCAGCKASMTAVVEFVAPGPRRLTIYECGRCAEDEPTEEFLGLVVAVAPKQAAAGQWPSWPDYPSESIAKTLDAPGFRVGPYRSFLEKHSPSTQASVGGWPRDEELLDISARPLKCGHRGVPLRLSSHCGGLRCYFSVEILLCIAPECARPQGTSEFARL